MTDWKQAIPARPALKARALACLIDRRPFPKGSPDWDWRTEAATAYMLMAMNIPAAARSARNV